MSEDKNNIFLDEEKDILQEVMNIAFGSATADLAEFIDIFVVLNVPQIQLMSADVLPEYIDKMLNSSKEIRIVDQKFWGDFSGSGFLVFSAEAGKQLVAIFDSDSNDYNDDCSNSISAVESSVLMEIGNILIGACVGKISELLHTFVTYSPPEIICSGSPEYQYLIDSLKPTQTVILMRTVFEFENKNVNGFLLIITNQESIGWLRRALASFMESFE